MEKEKQQINNKNSIDILLEHDDLNAVNESIKIIVYYLVISFLWIFGQLLISHHLFYITNKRIQ